MLENETVSMGGGILVTNSATKNWESLRADRQGSVCHGQRFRPQVNSGETQGPLPDCKTTHLRPGIRARQKISFRIAALDAMRHGSKPIPGSIEPEAAGEKADAAHQRPSSEFRHQTAMWHFQTQRRYFMSKIQFGKQGSGTV